MKRSLLIVLFLLGSALLPAQFSVVSTVPANNAKNVALTTTITITYNDVLDTAAMETHGKDSWFSNADSVSSFRYSADKKSVLLTVSLKPNSSYFVAWMYAKALSGAVMTAPQVFYFTTGADFAPYSVSGTVAPGTVNIPPAGSVVALSKVDFMRQETDGPPPFGGWANVNANGSYTIPNVAPGTYWPLVAKDVNGDGMLDPGKSGGDVVVMGDSIVVTSASLTNVNMTFFSLLSISPANLATNVPLTTTISLTFSEPLDTMTMNESKDSFFSSIDSMLAGGFSNGGRTMWSTVVLKPNTPYFVAFMYVRSRNGSVMSVPQIFYFTTGASFPTTTVSGTVSAGSTGVSPEGAIIGLAKVDFTKVETDGTPPFGGWSDVKANGTFTVPYVPNGTYWPLVAKDVDHDGQINPGNGVDVMALGDSIVVNNASVSNVNLTFVQLKPMMLSEVVHVADSLASAKLPADRSLRRISGYDVDTLGRSSSWEFAYSVNGNTMGKVVRVGTGEMKVSDMDASYFQWVATMKPVTGYQQAVSSAVVIAAAEAAGGRQVRLAKIPDIWEFRIELSFSNQRNNWFQGPDIDTTKSYWAAAYAYNYKINQNQNMWMGGMLFLHDPSTGAVLKMQPIWGPEAVPAGKDVPQQFALEQNYPNPFNPQTAIRYQLSAAGLTTLTVFDMLGREVATLVNERQSAGTYTVPFNAGALPSGVYLYRLRSGSSVQTKKMLLLK